MANLMELKNSEAEAMVLNAIFSRSENLHRVSSIVREEDFYSESNRCIFHALVEMVLNNVDVNIATLTEKLKRDGNLEKVGGLRTIAGMGLKGGIDSVEAQARIVAEYSRRRRIIVKAREIETLAGDAMNDISKVESEAVQGFTDITQAEEENIKSAKDSMLDVAALIDKRYNRKGDCILTGLADVDKRIVAIEPGQLVVIAGRPGHGKSAFATTMAYNLLLKGKRILIFSMEMSREEVLLRLVSRASRVESSKLKDPSLMDDKEWARYTQGLEKVAKYPLYIGTQGMLTPLDVSRAVKKYQAHGGLDLVIVDYLQLMSSGAARELPVAQEVANITRALKNLAVSQKVPIVLLSQLNRSNARENRTPKLTDLRDSGAIEQDANTVLLLHRELVDGTEQLSDVTSVNVAKQRDGMQGVCHVKFMPAFVCFVNLLSDFGGQHENKNFTPPA